MGFQVVYFFSGVCKQSISNFLCLIVVLVLVCGENLTYKI